MPNNSLLRSIPNLFTLLNLFFGCCAILFALQTESINIIQGDEMVTSFNIPERIYYASICIGIASIIDFLDGFVARLFKATSEMGKQLDSLSDVVSFGVAPSMIFYQFLRISYMREENGLDVNIGWLLPAFVFACAGAWRLAKFNVDQNQTEHFRGVPIPASGLVVASFPLIAFYNYFDGAINELLFNKWFLYALIFIQSYLMVGSLPMIALKFRERDIKSNMPKIILAVAALLSAVLLKWLAVPVMFVVYILVSLTFKIEKHDIHR
jgi:CDP-diacylglycerol--serine O-phosphatidyltransferase